MSLDFQATVLSVVRSSTRLPVVAGLAAVVSVLLVRHVIYIRQQFATLPKSQPILLKAWILNLTVKPFSRTDTTVPAPYDLAKAGVPYAPHGSTSFLSSRDGNSNEASALSITSRKGPRPAVPKLVAPHRQATDANDQPMRARMQAFLDAVVAANRGALVTHTSGLEGPPHPAIYFREAGLSDNTAKEKSEKNKKRANPMPKWLRRTGGEHAHIHPDGSSHLILSLADAAAAIGHGWAERHKLSGVVFPWGYVLIYAPRDAAELAQWKELVLASVRFCTAFGNAGRIRRPEGERGESER